MKAEWDSPGRNRMLPEASIEQVKFKLGKYSGSTLDNKELTTFIQEAQKQVVIGQGRVPITKQNIQPSVTTLRNYMATIAYSDGVSICTSVVPKTRTRFTAENSLISAMALLCGCIYSL